MVTKQIDNFTISESSDKIVVNYHKTFKDWFDTIFTLTIGISLLVATLFLLYHGLKTINFIMIISGLIFTFLAILQSASGISRLLQPTKNLLIIDMDAHLLISKHSPFNTKIISLDDLRSIVISGQKENLSYSKNRMVRTYCVIEAKITNKNNERLITINTNRFIRPSDQTLETELYSKAKRITSELNKHLKAKYEWVGFHENK